MPGVIAGLFIPMAAIQAAQSFISPEESAGWLARFAFVPARFTQVYDPRGVAAAITALSPRAREAALFFVGDGRARIWTFLTYALLHGGWPHLLANSIWLLAFGAPVATRLGAGRFLILFCAAAIGGALTQWAAHPLAFEPVVGASAGVSGIMAAAARFVFQPGGPLSPRLSREDGAWRYPPLTLLGCFRDSRVLAFVGVWFVVNLAAGLAAVPLGLSAEPIAWEAHIGGFLVGLTLFSALDRAFTSPEESLVQSADGGPGPSDIGEEG